MFKYILSGMASLGAGLSSIGEGLESIFSSFGPHDEGSYDRESRRLQAKMKDIQDQIDVTMRNAGCVEPRKVGNQDLSQYNLWGKDSPQKWYVPTSEAPAGYWPQSQHRAEQLVD